MNEDNSDEWGRLFESSLRRALEEVGQVAEGYAKRLCPVDPGRLCNSITHVTGYGAKAVYFGTNVEYARYVEMGTSRHKEQPYLRPAAQNTIGQYRAIKENALRNG